jgi:hypothetical protein
VVRVLSVVGARPQFIKAALISRLLRERGEEYLIHTGQHYDVQMSEVFFRQLDLPQPDLNLGIGALSNIEQVSHMLLGLRPAIEEQRPDWILVYGDTNSTLAALLELPSAGAANPSAAAAARDAGFGYLERRLDREAAGPDPLRRIPGARQPERQRRGRERRQAGGRGAAEGQRDALGDGQRRPDAGTAEHRLQRPLGRGLAPDLRATPRRRPPDRRPPLEASLPPGRTGQGRLQNAEL